MTIMQRRSLPSAALITCRIVALVTLAAATTAQVSQAQATPLASWETFLAAPKSEIDRVRGAVPVDVTEEIGAAIARQLPFLERTFGDSAPPIMFTTDGQGSSAHPEAGIGLDQRQFARLRDSLSTPTFDAVVRFLLAHEWAHMLQFKQYSREELVDPKWRGTLECHADLWAGISLANIAPDTGLTVEERRDLVSAYSTVTALLGNPGSPLPWMHPRPERRMRCLVTGLAAGGRMRQLAHYANTGDTATARTIRAWSQLDSRWFDSIDAGALRPWIEVTSFAIAANLHPVRLPWAGLFDEPIEIGRMMMAAHLGADTLRARALRPGEPGRLNASGIAGKLGVPSATECSFEEDDGAAWIACFFDDLPSLTIAKVLYDQIKDAAILFNENLGWVKETEVHEGGSHRQYFARTDRRARLLVVLEEGAQSVVVQATPEKSASSALAAKTVYVRIWPRETGYMGSFSVSVEGSAAEELTNRESQPYARFFVTRGTRSFRITALSISNSEGYVIVSNGTCSGTIDVTTGGMMEVSVELGPGEQFTCAIQ